MHKEVRVSLFNVMVLMYNLYLGLAEEEVGYEDAEQPLRDLEKSLDNFVYISLENLESLLWSSNLLDEIDKFNHPKGLTFRQFVRQLAPKNTRFDYTYNLFREIKSGNDK